ncbi:MAG: hypothetical protein GTN73_05210 [Candidatus Aminicenantes bacterium]|nr:hypothetical protein [Candidatus Aminicenantes bacterium]
MGGSLVFQSEAREESWESHDSRYSPSLLGAEIKLGWELGQTTRQRRDLWVHSWTTSMALSLLMQRPIYVYIIGPAKQREESS